jgi:hypothetical protein
VKSRKVKRVDELVMREKKEKERDSESTRWGTRVDMRSGGVRLTRLFSSSHPSITHHPSLLLLVFLVALRLLHSIAFFFPSESMDEKNNNCVLVYRTQRAIDGGKERKRRRRDVFI